MLENSRVTGLSYDPAVANELKRTGFFLADYPKKFQKPSRIVMKMFKSALEEQKKSLNQVTMRYKERMDAIDAKWKVSVSL